MSELTYKLIENEGVVAWSDTSRHFHGVALLISLFGPANAVKSIWASLSAKRGFEVGRGHLDSKTSYITLRQPLPQKGLHLTVIHPDATYQVGAWGKSFAVIGDGPSQYWDRFVRLCPVPVRNEWREKIWELGLRSGSIVSADGWGTPVFVVYTEASMWIDDIKYAIKHGDLK